jgi:F-box domain
MEGEASIAAAAAAATPVEFAELHHDCACEILKYLSPTDRGRLAHVNSKWRDIFDGKWASQKKLRLVYRRPNRWSSAREDVTVRVNTVLQALRILGKCHTLTDLEWYVGPGLGSWALTVPPKLKLRSLTIGKRYCYPTRERSGYGSIPTMDEFRKWDLVDLLNAIASQSETLEELVIKDYYYSRITTSAVTIAINNRGKAVLFPMLSSLTADPVVFPFFANSPCIKSVHPSNGWGITGAEMDQCLKLFGPTTIQSFRAKCNFPSSLVHYDRLRSIRVEPWTAPSPKSYNDGLIAVLEAHGSSLRSVSIPAKLLARWGRIRHPQLTECHVFDENHGLKIWVEKSCIVRYTLVINFHATLERITFHSPRSFTPPWGVLIDPSLVTGLFARCRGLKYLNFATTNFGAVLDVVEELARSAPTDCFKLYVTCPGGKLPRTPQVCNLAIVASGLILEDAPWLEDTPAPPVILFCLHVVKGQKQPRM